MFLFKLTGYPEWYKDLKKGQERAKVNCVDHEMETMSESGRSSIEEGGHDIGEIIQQELAKCLGNLMGKGSSSGSMSTNVNMVQKEDEGEQGFDGHYAFSIMPSMDEVRWIIDSLASAHICCNMNMMSSYERLPRPVRVHLPDGSGKIVHYTGSVRVNSDITLTNVLFLEGFTNIYYQLHR